MTRTIVLAIKMGTIGPNTNKSNYDKKRGVIGSDTNKLIMAKQTGKRGSTAITSKSWKATAVIIGPNTSKSNFGKAKEVF